VNLAFTFLNLNRITFHSACEAESAF
jgi:hypothetical protein